MGPSKKQRIIAVAVGGVILLIVLLIGASLIFGGGSSSKETSLKLAQLHTELIRVSEIGMDKAQGQSAKNIATTTNLTLQSSLPTIMEIATKDQKIEKKLLAAGQDSKTDKTLTDAEQRSQFDEAFIELLVVEIKEYQKALTSAFEESKSKNNKAAYDDLFKNLKKITDTSELSK